MRRVPPRRGALFASDAAGAGPGYVHHDVSVCRILDSRGRPARLRVFLARLSVCLLVVYIAVVTPPHRTAPISFVCFFLDSTDRYSCRYATIFSSPASCCTRPHIPTTTPTTPMPHPPIHPSACYHCSSCYLLSSYLRTALSCIAVFLHRSHIHTYMHTCIRTYMYSPVNNRMC